MKFGFVTAALKDFGKAALPLAEQVGIQAANVAAPGVGGFLANLAAQSINAAIAKHGTAPANTPAPSDPTITVGQAKKFDVLQQIESQAPEIMNLILAGRSKAVVDRAGFVDGTNEIVEGVLKVMKAIGAVPSSTPPVDPVMITPEEVKATAVAPAPAPLPAFKGTVANLDPPATTADPLAVAALLEQAVNLLRGK